MEEYNSTELMVQTLKKTGDPDHVNADILVLPDLLNKYIGRAGRTLTALAELADINRVTLYKILSGDMQGSRNILLRIALVLELSFDETQELLKSGGKAPLSVHRKRDHYISNAVIHRINIDDLNEQLIQSGLTGIYSKSDI